MSRHSYKTVNLPRDVVDWIDTILSSKTGQPGPLGIKSRDEFVRVAVAILGTALRSPNRSETPLDTIQQLVRHFQKEAVTA
ncbi:MAG: hypothetical protein ACYC2H_10400 [Thermoplasmatota archaeon]